MVRGGTAWSGARRPSRNVWTTVLLILVQAFAASGASAQPRASADAVVIVDTSTSMKQPGMDPERTSFLVTKLLADIVPGEFAVVRLLDIGSDRNLIGSRGTGTTGPCEEDPARTCEKVVPTSNWEADARAKQFGVLVRRSRAEPEFRTQLDSHLEQRINNSMFHLAFRAAQGVFDKHAPGPPRTVVWLSDGQSSSEPLLKRVIGELQGAKVAVEPVVFGRGDVRLAREIGLTPRRASTPAELMKAFAGVFRRIVEAPYELDGLISTQPTFEMKGAVDEAWIVVYGNDTLQAATVTGPRGSVDTDHAFDRHPGAGAYRVAYVTSPPAGRWTVSVTGGGPHVAYAVVQRSAIAPALIEPRQAAAGVRVPLVVGLRGGDGRLLGGGDVPPGVSLEAEVEGRTVKLVDDGTNGDAVAGDGRFTAPVVFNTAGDSTVTLRARGGVIDRHAREVVKVTIRWPLGSVDVDLGHLSHHAEACRDVRVPAERRGDVPLELGLLRALPSHHTLEIRSPRGVLRPGNKPHTVDSHDPLHVCLVTGAAASSIAANEPWLVLRAAGAPDGLTVRLRWEVQGLGFWARWGWLILLIAALLVLAAIVYGFIYPYRFGRGLSLAFKPTYEELDEHGPLPLRTWKRYGVRIGWYRHARAFLHPSFRLSGTPRDALASLHADRRVTKVRPEGGNALFRETPDGEWERVDGPRPIRPGEVHRVNEQGPYFRTSLTGT